MPPNPFIERTLERLCLYPSLMANVTQHQSQPHALTKAVALHTCRLTRSFEQTFQQPLRALGPLLMLKVRGPAKARTLQENSCLTT